MLGLYSDTDPKWVAYVENDLSTFMSDHLFAEQKAASNGFSFVMQYPELTGLTKFMGQYAYEESEHFRRVLTFMQERGIPLQRDRKSAYVKHLRSFFKVSDDKMENLVNRLLIASLIEARSCERFALFSKKAKDPELAQFYHNLIKEEVGHYKAFLSLAKQFQDEAVVDEKWEQLKRYEADYMKNMGQSALVHG
ncbi:MAG: tRNA 2-methylthio-N6-isopentenyl adenosine(37) hydroxylase MiaE [Bacteroidetes bacterium]|nr:MAG: tRNA 2-methylthio-N6-isopentenyl adenosine(37) hydroxylase MiaE [Bacteroidota bacterium]